MFEFLFYKPILTTTNVYKTWKQYLNRVSTESELIYKQQNKLKAMLTRLNSSPNTNTLSDGGVDKSESMS